MNLMVHKIDFVIKQKVTVVPAGQLWPLEALHFHKLLPLPSSIPPLMETPSTPWNSIQVAAFPIPVYAGATMVPEISNDTRGTFLQGPLKSTLSSKKDPLGTWMVASSFEEPLQANSHAFSKAGFESVLPSGLAPNRTTLNVGFASDFIVRKMNARRNTCNNLFGIAMVFFTFLMDGFTQIKDFAKSSMYI